MNNRIHEDQFLQLFLQLFFSLTKTALPLMGNMYRAKSSGCY